MIEVHHQLLEIALAHLPWPIRTLASGTSACTSAATLSIVFHFVVNEVHLSAAAQLAQGRLPQCRTCHSMTNVLMANRSAGGVVINERSAVHRVPC